MSNVDGPFAYNDISRQLLKHLLVFHPTLKDGFSSFRLFFLPFLAGAGKEKREINILSNLLMKILAINIELFSVS